MLYVKILSGDEMIGLEAIEDPVYVKLQTKNNMIVRCLEPLAQGILSADGSTIYQLEGKESMGGDYDTAMIITLAEYEELLSDYEDPEDSNPEIPEGETEDDILTRAQLTAKVAELEEQLAATKILLGVE